MTDIKRIKTVNTSSIRLEELTANTLVTLRSIDTSRTDPRHGGAMILCSTTEYVPYNPSPKEEMINTFKAIEKMARKLALRTPYAPLT